MARVLVTGGAGFIGSELVTQLLAAGHVVDVIDNLATGHRKNLDGHPEAQLTLHIGDIRDESLVRSLLETADFVMHLACLGVRHSIHSPHENHDVNATATLNLLRWAQSASQVQRFIHVSTSEVYGSVLRDSINETHPTFPHTVYGAAKLAGESYARAAYRTYGLPVVIVRPFNAYGPRSHHEGDSGEVIPKFMLRAMTSKPLLVFGDGLQTRDFMHVSDTAAALVRTLEAPDLIGQTLNVASGAEVSVLDLAEVIGNVIGAQCVIEYRAPRPGDLRRLRGDATLARELLQWAPRVTLKQGLTRLYQWYQQQPQGPEVLLQSDQEENWRG